MATYLTVVPSYGRDYKSAKAALADWNAGKDFTIATFGANDGRQINKQDADADANIKVNIRYDNLRKICNAKK